MKPITVATTALLAAISFAAPVVAEDIEDVHQLLTTKECSQCDLRGSGLVMVNLSGAQLSGANLSRANLSRADLSGADLSGADLSGASLHGANLSGAKLIGANLHGTDLRNAYLVNAIVIGVSFDTAYMQGVIGMPNYAATPEQFLRWGIAESNKGKYRAAIEHYNRALATNPEFAPAYISRGLARFRMNNYEGAIADGEMASQLFELQGNESGQEAAEKLLTGIDLAMNPEEKGGGASFEQILGQVGGLLLKFFFR